jgi:hypothetical protein
VKESHTRIEAHPMKPLLIIPISQATALAADAAAQKAARPGDARQAKKGRTDASTSRSVDEDARRSAPAMRVPSYPHPNREFRGGSAPFARIKNFSLRTLRRAIAFPRTKPGDGEQMKEDRQSTLTSVGAAESRSWPSKQLPKSAPQYDANRVSSAEEIQIRTSNIVMLFLDLARTTGDQAYLGIATAGATHLAKAWNGLPARPPVIRSPEEVCPLPAVFQALRWRWPRLGRQRGTLSIGTLA